MKAIKQNQIHHSGHAVCIRSCRTRFEDRISSLINAACAARAGAAQMTLSDWREVEQDVKRKLQYEN